LFADSKKTAEKSYSEYFIEVRTSKRNYTITRRYKEFATLYQWSREHYPSVVLHAKKDILGTLSKKISASNAKERRVHLENYLHELIAYALLLCFI
jgi:hypothetical protein